MFRLLNLGDKPFRRASEQARLAEIAITKGLAGQAYKTFMTMPDDVSLEDAQNAGLEATFQKENFIMVLLHSATKNPKIKERLEKYKHFLPFTKLIGKTQAPYVNTPLNIAQELVEYGFPAIPLVKGIGYAMNGERKNALMDFSKAMVGLILAAVAQWLVDDDLVTSGSTGDSEKERRFNNEYNKYNRFNLSAARRKMSGGDAKWRDGDETMEFSKLGIVGGIISVHANLHKKALTKGDVESEPYETMLKIVPTIASTTLEQTFLANTNTLLNALKDGDGQYMDRWLVQTSQAIGAIAFPNTIASISKANDEYMRDVKGATVSETIVNNFNKKLSAFRDENELPSRITLCGEKVKNVPEDRSPYPYILFDITHSEKIPQGRFGVELLNLYKRTLNDDVLPSAPSRKITVGGKSTDLTPKQYEDFQTEVGSARKALVGLFVNSDEWIKQTSDESKIDILKYAYENGYDVGLENFKTKNNLKTPIENKKIESKGGLTKEALLKSRIDLKVSSLKK